MLSTQKLLFEAKSLPVEDRANLVDSLLKTLNVPDPELDREWLEVAQWLAIRKKHASAPGVFYEDAVAEALCFGWIDGVMRSAMSDFYYLRFSPRKRGSVWSVSNQKRVKQLIAHGQMTASNKRIGEISK